jgi:hypothetical protein
MSKQPVKRDFKNIRELRQVANINNTLDLIEQKNEVELKKNCNQTALERVKDYLDVDIEQLFDECSKNKYTACLLAMNIAKNSTRQGSKDEDLQFEVCNLTMNPLGVKIKNLSVNKFRPSKSGVIAENTDKVNKDDCLKSFDGKIEGKMTGWTFNKVSYGSGGHQDNVFREAHEFCDWVIAHRMDDDYIYVVIIDTDQTKKMNTLKKKKNTKLLIVDHFEFQQYVIEKFG